jgi:hypothetical protein
MTLNWEAIGALFGILALAVAANAWVMRAVVQAELKKWAVRPLGECKLIHVELNRRLDKLEETTK